MAPGGNKVILVGTCGQDPETRYLPNGNAVTNLSLATSEQWTDKQTGQKVEKTEWHRVSLFGKVAEIAGEYLRKGSQVYIEGKLQTREWEKDGIKRYTTEIIVDMQGTMQLLGGRPDNAGGDSAPRCPDHPCLLLRLVPGRSGKRGAVCCPGALRRASGRTLPAPRDSPAAAVQLPGVRRFAGHRLQREGRAGTARCAWPGAVAVRAARAGDLPAACVVAFRLVTGRQQQWLAGTVSPAGRGRRGAVPGRRPPRQPDPGR